MTYPRLITFLLLCLVTLGQSAPQYQPEITPSFFPGDFIEYWASARLLLSGGNPYSAEEQLVLQRSVVGDIHQPLMMWNPPWTLTLILPFGLTSFALGHLLWSILILALLLFSSAQLWRLYGGPTNKYWVAWVACLSIVPTYLTLYLTQIDPLVLLGIVGFLYYQQRQQWWYAGASLTLIAIKPHLVMLFWVALIAWIVKESKWKVCFGAVMAAIALLLIPIALSPRIFTHYLEAYSTTGAPRPFDWASHNLSAAIDIYFQRELPWIRFVPSLCAFGWFMFYWRRHRNAWNWTEQMPLLLLVSQTATVFAWVWDQIVLLPALICAAVWALGGGASRRLGTILGAIMLINLPPLLILTGLIAANFFWLFWMVPAYLIVYQLFQIRPSAQERCPS